ncbi:rhodanese-like domain-containing protein [Xanthobacter oligotrophicus]|uniref:rhodanese-like domain-containing protein n=1 Tax=Xanthobacter oligotrophicus TaxID=2607286 RepID=UPI001AED5859|nr:rhodanese-like domain-containing protein [Xanthobacter oligotrophicus]MCG5237205.1 sulfurtransferase [Xanthobacter oligotrophicus]
MPPFTAHIIDVPQLRKVLEEQGELALLDVREEGEFGEGHLFFSVNAPYSRLELQVVALVPRRATPVVLVDDGDGLAQLAARRLGALGYGDVAVLEGGIPAWISTKNQMFKSVNSRSKAFAEVVEHAFHTPAIEAAELDRLRRGEADVVVLDSRTPEEFERFHVPDAVSCPGADLVLKFDTFVTHQDQLVVVSCAGRTRGIIGAQSLIDAGVPNRVLALKGGTQGWRLAGLDLEHGTIGDFEFETTSAARGRAEAVRRRFGVPVVDQDRLALWLTDAAATRTTYVFDLRDEAERQADPLPGAVPAPGGQLVQALDRWVGVQRARIALVDDDGVRARMTGHWLIQLGEDVHVLEGPRDRLRIPPPPATLLAPVATVSAVEAAALIAAGGRAVSLEASAAFRAGHAAGAVWSIRPRLAGLPPAVLGAPVIVLFADETVAALAALDLKEITPARIVAVAGGLAAWSAAGLPVEAPPHSPPDAERIDYLFWAHDRHDGNAEAMRTYLGWEEQLPQQVAAEGGGGFRLVSGL